MDLVAVVEVAVVEAPVPMPPALNDQAARVGTSPCSAIVQASLVHDQRAIEEQQLKYLARRERDRR